MQAQARAHSRLTQSSAALRSTEPKTAFALALTAHQAQLYAFVFAQVADPHLAHDVFQETNRVLWEEAKSFDASRAFLPWAIAIARNQVRAARQRQRRDRLRFGESTLERIADRMTARVEHLAERQVALADCVQRLPAGQRKLVEERYSGAMSIAEIASRESKSRSAIAVALFRIRRSLAECIQNVLGESR